MKNKFTLGLAAIFTLGVSIGSYQYYKENIKPVNMTVNDAQIVVGLYVQQQVCSTFGLTETKPEQDLFPLIKRIEMNNIKEHYPNADKEKAVLKLDMVQRMVDTKIQEVKEIYQSADGSNIDFFADAAYCEQSLYKAQNLVKKYK